MALVMYLWHKFALQPWSYCWR